DVPGPAGGLGQHAEREVAPDDGRVPQLGVDASRQQAGAATDIEDVVMRAGDQIVDDGVLHRPVDRPLHPGQVVEPGPDIEEEALRPARWWWRRRWWHLGEGRRGRTQIDRVRRRYHFRCLFPDRFPTRPVSR